MPNERARALRREQTDAEAKLWWRLRAGKLPGYWFKRQVPLGPYIVDFACLKAGLLVEVDGGQHADQVERDDRRTTWLESQGFRLLRFWNHQVLLETDDVVETIWIALDCLRREGMKARFPFDPPLPALPRRGEGVLGEGVLGEGASG